MQRRSERTGCCSMAEGRCCDRHDVVQRALGAALLPPEAAVSVSFGRAANIRQACTRPARVATQCMCVR